MPTIERPEVRYSVVDCSVTIRPAVQEDGPMLAACIEPFVSQGRLLRRTGQEFDQLLPHCFVAEVDGRVVGCAALEIYSPKLAELRSLCVMTEFQGQGIGRKLVDACIKRARDYRILEVMAITSSEDFFRTCGFDFTLPGEKKALFLQTRDSDSVGGGVAREPERKPELAG